MNKLRIISGLWRGRTIKGVDWEGTRPVTDRVKENIFNLLGPNIDGIVLDLFAGSGSLGLEALSRGAQRAVFNELNNEPAKILRDNIATLKASEVSNISREDCFNYIKKSNEKFSLIFLDPPFPKKENEKLLSEIIENKILADDGRIMLRIPRNDQVDLTGFEVLKDRNYGTSRVLILEVE